MFIHYIKIAFRNLRKYKTQNIISIIGLAVGFACFAFSTLWLRYEISYDSFHPKADRIYRIHTDVHKYSQGGSTSEIYDTNPYPLAGWLKSEFPEIEDACAIRSFPLDEKINCLYADFSFCNIFDANLPEDFFVPGRTDRPVAVTGELKEYVGYIKEKHNYDVQTSISHWPANTNIPFNMVVPATLDDPNRHKWGFYGSYHTYILVRKGVDIQALEEKLDKVTIPQWAHPISVIMTPLKQLRYQNPSGNMASDIKFSHIRIFAIAGLLVILSSLFNHLTLYVTRVRMRLRGLALRKVNGATNWQIAAMLYTDFLLVIVLSLVVGFILMSSLLPTFKEYATIGNNNISIYTELLLYAALLIACGFVACGIPVMYFRKQALNNSIKGTDSPGSRNIFRKACLLVQLIISLGLMFCSVVFIKQIRFLQHTDLGIKRNNIAAVSTSCCPLLPDYSGQIKQVPGVKDALPITSADFLRNTSSMSGTVNAEKDGKMESYTIFYIMADAHFFDFFGVEIIEGAEFSNEYNKKMVYNETAMKDLGSVLSNSQDKVGVVRDFYFTPTTKSKPSAIYFPGSAGFRAIAYKYEEGMRQQIEQAVIKWLHELFPDKGEFEVSFTYMEDVFDEYFKSERALLSLLSIMTIVCILISIFGVYSLTSLTCEQRRKEIAIRKVNGAEVLDIMNIFFKEYLLLLFLAAFVAFPAGYIIMKRWLEGYVKQTSMDAWLFVLIFLVVFVVIVFTIVSMVWKAANQNPAEVVKAE